MDLVNVDLNVPPRPPDPPGEKPDEVNPGADGAGSKTPPTLESLALDQYLLYLESEATAYCSLVESPSVLLKGLAQKLLKTLKNQVRSGPIIISLWEIFSRFIEIVLKLNDTQLRTCLEPPCVWPHAHSHRGLISLRTIKLMNDALMTSVFSWMNVWPACQASFCVRR